jgi:3-oxoacyl-[acyl-carrier protein] reductase
MTAASSSFSLRGRRAAVLGATSGIGRAVAVGLAEAGADVIVHGRTSARAADDLASDLRSRGVRSQALMADLADRAAGDRLVEQAWGVWNGLDAWLHIAGADTLTGPNAQLSFDA